MICAESLLRLTLTLSPRGRGKNLTQAMRTGPLHLPLPLRERAGVRGKLIGSYPRDSGTAGNRWEALNEQIVTVCFFYVSSRDRRAWVVGSQ